MGESWIVSNLNAALSTWNDKLAEIWSLLTESPQTFKGGQVWGVMTGIHGALQAIGYGLLVLFFAVGVMKTCGSFVEVKKPEHALKLFIRFALAKGAVTYGLELMLAVFSIVQGMVSTIITQSGSSGMSSVSLPQELIDAINNVGFWDSIPLWAVTLIGGLLITVLSFTMILTVYGRMFSLWMYAAIAPIPLSTFAGEPTSSVGKNFIRSYAGVCLQGVVIALSCIIFSAISSSPPAVDTSASVVTAVWTYVGELAFNLLVLFFAVGVMKTCGSFVEVKKPEHALKLFIRFALAKGAVTYGLELMLAVFSIVQGMVSTIITQSDSSGMSSVTLPQELIDAINNVGFWDSIPLWAVTLIGGLLITVLSFTMILTVYGRMFSLWMYAAIAPIPLSTFAGEPTSSVGKNFIRSYAGVCLQGVVIALSCIIFSAISSSPPAVDTGASVVTAVWTYVGELAFNLLVLVGAIKGCDRIVKEIMGL